jgi:serine/threonine protein kinase
MVGKKFAQYVILEEAGTGGMGVVYRARDETLNRDVALKLPWGDAASNEEARARVLREARAASALNHPNICTIYEVGEAEGQPYIAMEYLAGETLSRRIPLDGLPTESVLALGAQIADALDHAHTHGILHRDLKSSNVRLTATGQLKVLDFGLAQNLKDGVEGATRSTNPHSDDAAGTTAYMAPELLQGKSADTRTDIWSLGVVLYELAAGRLPFNGRTKFELGTHILRESPESLPTHVTPGLRGVIMRCLSKEADQRYQRASEIRAAMEALQSDTGVALRVDQAPPRQHTIPYLLAAAGVLAMAAVAVLLFLNRGNKAVDSPATSGKLRLFKSSEVHLSGPALSPDGKMVAYVQAGAATDDLYVSRVAGGEHLRLTTDTSRKDHPQFSPDGEKIVFVRRTADAAQTELCLIPALGGGIVPLLVGGDLPAWSPDGSRLAFILRKQGEPEQLATSAADGSDLRILLKGDDVYPFFGLLSWSVDGSQLAFFAEPRWTEP